MTTSMAKAESTRSARSSKRGSRKVEQPRVERRTGPAPVRLVLVLTGVFGETKALADHGDVATLNVILKHHDQIAATAARIGARVVKYLGSGALLTVPVSRAREAMAALRALQVEGTKLWSAFDERCSVRVNVTAGQAIAGMFGSGDRQRYDVFGSAVNQLFKAPWGNDVQILPEAASLLS